MTPSFKSDFLRHVAQTSGDPDGFEVSRGEGIYLFDREGRPFIDCISGIAVSSLGHHHPGVREAIISQLEQYLHTSVYGEHVQPIQVELATKLATFLPPNLDSVFFVNSGAEAVEGGLKLARKYTGRYEIVACRHAYHGSTAGAESLRSDLEYTAAARPLVPGIRHMNFNSFDDLSSITSKTAAVILEPVQGEAGVIEPAAGYLQAVRQRCDETGALLIFDEIQAGMGRTGTLWAFEQENVVPDILLLAKAFGGGLPLGAFISGREIMHVLAHDPILGHITTFGGNPLCCAASLAVLNTVSDDGFLAHVKDVGYHLKTAWQGHSSVREVRGRGLMVAIELHHPEQVRPVIRACRQQGLLVDWFLFNSRSIRLYPPLTIQVNEIKLLGEKLIHGLDQATC